MFSERAVGCIEGLGLATLIAKRTGANPKLLHALNEATQKVQLCMASNVEAEVQNVLKDLFKKR